MHARLFFGSVVTLAAFSCGDGTSIDKFSYGGQQPGADKPEGGEIRHENVRILGLPEQTWLAVYQYTGPSESAPFPAPAANGTGVYGPCVDERQGSPTWPFHPITGATYLTLPKVQVSGPGFTGAADVPKTNPPNTVGNSTFRVHDFTYGGGAPGNPPKGYNGTLTAANSQPGGEYILDIGKGEPMHYFMPETFTAPLGIGGAATVMIKSGQDLSFTWTPPANDFGESGFEHTKKTHFNFTFFADPTDGAQHALFICFPSEEGKQTIPAAVIDALPPGGLIVNANLSHYLEAREGSGPSDIRRFDLVTIFCNISAYQKF
jgi:hypothetical protein